MSKFTMTLLGLTFVTAFSASQADAGLFDWFGATPGYATPRVTGYAASYGTNSSYNCGPNGCSTCPDVRNGSTVQPSASYGYGASTHVYRPTTNGYYPSAVNHIPASNNYRSSYDNWDNRNGTSYTNGHRGTPAYNAPATRYNAPVNSHLNNSHLNNSHLNNSHLNNSHLNNSYLSGTPYFGGY